VPVDRGAALTAELDWLFALLTPTEAEGENIVALAQREARARSAADDGAAHVRADIL